MVVMVLVMMVMVIVMMVMVIVTASRDCDREPSDAPPGHIQKSTCKAGSCRAPLQSSGAFFVAGGTRALSAGGRVDFGRRRVSPATTALS